MLADGRFAYVSNFLGSSGSINSVSVIDTNPSSPTFNSTLDTPGLNLPYVTRFLCIIALPNEQYVYAFDAYNNNAGVIPTGIVEAPVNFSGCKLTNTFLTFIDNINRLTWTAPILGNPPVAYTLYRDAALTQLVATLPANVLTYDDHNRNPEVVDTYYLVAADAAGDLSQPAVTTVTTACA
jgi:hypothetical protein